jgi:RHS repeat-associated protein
VKIFDGEACLTVSDLYLPGPFPISLMRSYTSNSTYAGPLGRGWDFPYDVHLDREGADLVLRKSGEELHRFEAPDMFRGPIEGVAFDLRAVERRGWRVESKAEHLAFLFVGDRGRMSVAAIEDRHGNVVKLERDSSGRLATLTDPLSRRLDFDYQGARLQRVVFSTHGAARVGHLVLECGYDAHDNLAWTSNGSRARATYVYDRGKLVAYTNPLGGTYCAQYDPQGRCIQVWEQHGRYSRRFAYDPVRLTTEVVDSAGYSSLYRFDAQGRLIEKVDPLGGQTSYVRNENGELIVELNPLGQPSVFYNAEPDGSRLTKTDADGSSTALEFGRDGEVTAVIDAAGSRWEYERDERGRIASLRSPLANRWAFEYDRMGRVGKARNPDGRDIEHQWSADGRHYRASDPLGTLAEKQFDSLGRLVAFRGLRGAAFSVRYDGALHEIRNVDGSVRRYEMNAMESPIRLVDELGSEWRFDYDLYGRPVGTIDPMGARVVREYDGEGRIRSVTNENGERLENTRDALGRIVRQRGFDGCERSYSYDAAGRLVSRIDGNRAVLNIEPDGFGRPRVRRYDDGSVVETDYGIGDRLERASDEGGTLQFEYDAESRRTTERLGDLEVRWEYGWDRRPVGLRCGGRDIRFDYDPRGELRKVVEGDHFTLTFDRDLNGESSTFHTGLSIRREYDPRGRVVAQEVFSRDGSRLLSASYRYDGRSNRVETLRSEREPLSFSHNRKGELIQVQRAGQVIRDYSYDPAGNRLQSGAEVLGCGAGNRVLRVGFREYEYDGEGRPVVERRAGSERSFLYDSRGRLLEVRPTTAPPVRFSYDFRFRRTRKLIGHHEDRTIWAGDSVLEQRLGSGACLAYVFHPAYRTPLAVQIDGDWHAMVCDQRGELTDVVRLSDETVVWSSDALGFESEVRVGDPDFAVQFRGAGQSIDRETGLSYQRARYYDPSTGRFLTPDPLGVYGGFNLYRFCLNQPFVLTDPFGLQPCPLSEAECNALFQNIEDRAQSVGQRWEDMHNPHYDLPWEGAPPASTAHNPSYYAAPAVGAMGTSIAVGDESHGSIDTHLRNYDEEQRGLQRQIQNYHEGQCGRFEDRNRALAMEQHTNTATRPPSLPHLGL